MHNSLISTHQLSVLLSRKDTSGKSSKLRKILFTTMNSGPAIRPKIVKEHENSYIPNSILFDFQNNFVEPNAPYSNTMPNAEVFEKKARDLGINNEDEIIVYDDFGNFCASRVWFMFRAIGFKNIKVLDGGLPLWLIHNYPTENALSKPEATGNFSCKQQDNFGFVDKYFILQNIQSKAKQLVDARSNSRFTGIEKESKPNVRSGHIPDSKNLHYAELFDKQGKFLPLDDLQRKFQNFESDLIFSCGSGVTACILAQVAHMTGKSTILVYDGSWSEWGAEHDLPVEQGE